MDFEFSQGREAGATIFSPIRGHHLDALSGLRRSLSKSPSKINFHPASSPSSSPISFAIRPSPPQTLYCDTASAPNLDISCPPSAKKFRPSLRRHTPLRVRTCPTSTPRVSVRRALSDASDRGNGSPSAPHQTKVMVDGQENCLSGTGQMTAFKARNALELTPPNPTTGNFAKSSPLKGNEGAMNLDRSIQESPSMKRKSVTGGFSSSPFDIACENPTIVPENVGESGSSDSDEDMATDAAFRSPLAPRLFNLRKSTLFKSSDRPGIFRTRRSVDGGMDSPKSPRVKPKGRPRFSLDSALPESSTADDSSGMSASDADSLFGPRPRNPINRSPRQHLPHPLSQAQALSPTSGSFQARGTTTTGNSIFARPAAPVVSFSKSLPIGALRPALPPAYNNGSYTSLATPEAHKMARPNPAAFRSTGLISKRHRNPDDLPPPAGANLGMPDTPCKRLTPSFPLPCSPSPINTVVKPKFAQPQFGTPSKPFNPHSNKPNPLALGKSTGVFGSSFAHGPAKRRESFTSFEGEDLIQSPTAPTDSQSSADELPPTPTKQANGGSHPKQNSLRSSLLGRHPSLAPHTFVPPDPAEPHPVQTNSLFLQPTKSWATTKSSPKTPADNTFPDPSSLSISPQLANPLSPPLHSTFGRVAPPPETPTHRDGPIFPQMALMTPSNDGLPAKDVDPVLISRFKRVEWYGRGEFSEVYKVYNPAESPISRSYFSPNNCLKSSQTPKPDKVWIVKKSIRPHISAKVRERRLEEVSIMRGLGKSDHIVHLIDSWEAGYHLYIQTEFCEEGNLEAFLARAGQKDRLDDFRIWKILTELCSGLKHIHDSGFIHLDLKPANVFIDFEGVLKIGDFGMAVRWPAPCYAESEGDRRYIGPDLLEGRLDKPADIFALGVMMVEIAGNCIPPDNGTSWQKLRSGDWSDIPSLTGSSSNSILRDSQKDLTSGGPGLFMDAEEARSYDSLYRPGSIYADDTLESASNDTVMMLQPRYDDCVQPPAFMLDPEHDEALDKLVHWMMAPRPEDRPVVDQILNTGGVHWVDARRRAGAVVFEGRWGPPEHRPRCIGQEDAEMQDVL